MLDWFLAHLRTQLFKISDTEVTPVSLILFLLTLGLTGLAAHLVKRAVFHLFDRGDKKEVEGLAYAIARMCQYTVYAIGTILALDNLGVDIAAFAAVGAVATVGIGFGLQNVAQNFISGMILLIERPVQKGDFIVVGETVGTVVAIELRATKVVSRDGVAIIVPNSELISTRVINQSSPTSKKRTNVQVGVAYGSDVELVARTLQALALAHPKVEKTPEPKAFFKDFGESALLFNLTAWIGHPDMEPQVTSDLRFAIDREFRALGIEIPFPQQEVRIKRDPAA